jgi:hypothetical protein
VVTEGSIVRDTETQDRPTPLSPRQRRPYAGEARVPYRWHLSLALSVGLWFLTEDRQTAIFVGLWVPSLFSLGALVAAGESGR